MKLPLLLQAPSLILAESCPVLLSLVFFSLAKESVKIFLSKWSSPRLVKPAISLPLSSKERFDARRWASRYRMPAGVDPGIQVVLGDTLNPGGGTWKSPQIFGGKSRASSWTSSCNTKCSASRSGISLPSPPDNQRRSFSLHPWSAHSSKRGSRRSTTRASVKRASLKSRKVSSVDLGLVDNEYGVGHSLVAGDTEDKFLCATTVGDKSNESQAKQAEGHVDGKVLICETRLDGCSAVDGDAAGERDKAQVYRCTSLPSFAAPELLQSKGQQDVRDNAGPAGTTLVRAKSERLGLTFATQPVSLP